MIVFCNICSDRRVTFSHNNTCWVCEFIAKQEIKYSANTEILKTREWFPTTFISTVSLLCPAREYIFTCSIALRLNSKTFNSRRSGLHAISILEYGCSLELMYPRQATSSKTINVRTFTNSTTHALSVAHNISRMREALAEWIDSWGAR